MNIQKNEPQPTSVNRFEETQGDYNTRIRLLLLALILEILIFILAF